MEISTLLSPNSQPEIMFLESILDSDLFSDITSAQSMEASFQVNSSKSESSESLHHLSPVNQSSRRSFNLTQESPTKVHLPSLNKHQSTLTIHSEFEDQEKRKELEAKRIIVEKLRSRLDSLKQNSFAHKLNRMPYYTIALNRLPAILTTITLEMGVSLVIISFKDLMKSHMLIAAFFPVLSAIAGNIGLQSSTATLRALATGHASTSISSVTSVVSREILSSGIIGLISGLVLFVVSSISSSNFYFGLVTGLAIFLNSMFSGMLGSIGPMAFKLYGVDPALMAGPFETALQDVIGTLIYLILASLLL